MNPTITEIAAVAAIFILGLVVGSLVTSHFQSPPATTQLSSQTTQAATSLSTSPSSAPTSSVQTSLATTTATPSNATYAIQLEYNISIGRHLVNSTRFSIYLNSQDRRYNTNGSVCYGQCAYYWHAFYVANLTVQPPLNISKFGTITRVGGAKQLTYEGYPLYTYTVDTHPGQIAGQGVAGTWNLVTFPNLST